MTHTTAQSKAVAAGTAAGLRHLERVYVAKVNAALADDRDDLAQELADDHTTQAARHAAAAARAAAAERACEPRRSLHRPRCWFNRGRSAAHD